MARNLRTALLTTAVASGLLLSSAPVQAQIIEGETATRQGPVAETVQEPAARAAEISAQEPISATAPDQGVDAAEDQEAVGAQVVQDVAPVDAQQSSPGSESATETSQTAESPEVDTAQTPDDGAVAETQGSGPGTATNPGDAPVLVTAQVVETTVPGPASTQAKESGVPESEDGNATEVEWDLVDLPWWLDGIEIPEGAENWTDAQWDDFITQNAQELENETAFQELGSITGDLVEHGRERDLDALYGHLLWMFDGNEAAARAAFEEIVFGLIEDGELDGGILDPKESESPQPSAKPEPTNPAEEPKPGIEPAGTVIKPAVVKTPTIEAVLKPVMNSQAGELAETGSSGLPFYAGAGAAMLLLGAVALRMRGKPRAH